MKRCLVIGGAGFIGTHLIKRLKADGHWVRAVDRKSPEFEASIADEFWHMDLRYTLPSDPMFNKIDEVYQLACEVGGLGYIMNRNNDADMLRNSMQINLNVLEACRWQRVPKVFFASSACVYPTMPIEMFEYRSGRMLSEVGAVPIYRALREEDAYPAHPDNEYAWEKLFAERLYDAYARNYDMQVRIARFHNCYGSLGTWTGGREKAPAAIMRKVAEAEDGTWLQVWGNGTATRSFMYVDDAVEGTVRLMASDFQQPVNIGSSEMVTVDVLVDVVCEVAGKKLVKKHVEGPPVGVQGRNSDNMLIAAKLGWAPLISLREGIKKTYPWIARQVDKAKEAA